MRILIPARVAALAAYTVVLLGGAFGISYGVFEWRDDDEPTTGQPEAINAESGGEKSFSMTLKTADDFQEAARRIGTYMPDFDCTGEWDEESEKGALSCNAGLTGFDCELLGKVHARQGVYLQSWRGATLGLPHVHRGGRVLLILPRRSAMLWPQHQCFLRGAIAHQRVRIYADLPAGLTRPPRLCVWAGRVSTGLGVAP